MLWKEILLFLSLHVTNHKGGLESFFRLSRSLNFACQFALVSIFLFRKHLELERHVLQIVFWFNWRWCCWQPGDRLFREPAEVVDFIDVYLPLINYDYPIFNIADSAIFIGAIVYLIIGFTDSQTTSKT